VEVAARATPSFVAPRFDTDIDMAAYLARVPPDAYCKGMFFHDVLAAVRSVDPAAAQQLTRRRFIPFKDYPLREHMELTEQAVRLLYPGVPTREAMRRLGWLAYPTFVDSMIGRVVFGVLGKDLDRIFEVGPKSFDVSLTRGRAVARRLGPQHWRYEMRDIFGYLDAYYVGVVEGPIRHHGHVPDVRVHLTTLSDGAMDIRWS
jgi:uncharacterized protein (TIGR02265 family)